MHHVSEICSYLFMSEREKKIFTNKQLMFNIGVYLIVYRRKQLKSTWYITALIANCSSVNICVSQNEVIKILTPYCSKSKKNLTLIPVCWTKCSSLFVFQISANFIDHYIQYMRLKWHVYETIFPTFAKYRSRVWFYWGSKLYLPCSYVVIVWFVFSLNAIVS